MNGLRSTRRVIAEKIGKSWFIVWDNGLMNGPEQADWAKASLDGKFNFCLSYRLRADYVCEHPVQTVARDLGNNTCSWCGAEIKPEPKMGWVEKRDKMRSLSCAIEKSVIELVNLFNEADPE
jgi:hypothetical protein